MQASASTHLATANGKRMNTHAGQESERTSGSLGHAWS